MKRFRQLILMLVDCLLISTAFIFSELLVRPGYTVFNGKQYLQNDLIICAVYITCFYIFRLYDSLWEYAGTEEFLLGIFANMSAGSIGYFLLKHWSAPIPFNIMVVSIILSCLLVLGLRISYRVYRRILFLTVKKGKYKNINSRVMIIGAGEAAALIIKEMVSKAEMKYAPVALIDDNPDKLGKRIHGIKVMGNRTMITKICNVMSVDTIIIAIPSIDVVNMNEILSICKRTGCKIKHVPGMKEIINGDVSLKKVKDVEIEDLLGRDPISLDTKGIREYISNKVVMVTGGGGSIGSELCRQIARYAPSRLIILDFYENNAYELQQELLYSYPELNLKVAMASVRDRKRLEQVFNDNRPQVVFHAAAHKHVPLMEDCPSEAVKNNVFGTLNAAECADKYGVERFVMISTDKAVNPTNIMGATKRICEMIVQAMDKKSKTHFVAVRFGNVLGSNGSVIPLFKKQIAKGGPVTVTHKNVTRYFMTIPEASQLVLQAAAFARGGEIFVLDMGKPIKIYDLACDLIRLSGYKPNVDIKIEVTGLRPGEKLYEELLMDEEGLQDTEHDKIFVGRPTFSDMTVLKKKLEEMRFTIENCSKEQVIKMVEEMVPTYRRDRHVIEEVAAAKEDAKQSIG